MALFSKKEFSGRCGIKTKVLSVYLKRGKVILTGESIDDSLPQNQAFIKKHSGKAVNGKSHEPGVSHKSKKEAVPKEVQKSFNLDIDRKVVEIERAELGKQLLQAKLNKERGEVISFDDVKASLGMHFRDCTTFISQGIQNLITEMAHKAKLNINQKAELNGAMQRVLNDSINRSIDATIVTLRSLQKAQSIKRDVGERSA